MSVPDFVMVPVAAGGPTKPTTSYQTMLSQPMSKPSTVTVPKSSTIPGTGISLLKGEKFENRAVSMPLSVETLPASNEPKPNLSAKVTLDVETNRYVTTDTDAVTSEVETEQSTVTSHVGTELLAQQP